MSQRKTLVVAGHGMVGHRLVHAAVERGLTERFDIVVGGEDALVAGVARAAIPVGAR